MLRISIDPDHISPSKNPSANCSRIGVQNDVNRVKHLAFAFCLVLASCGAQRYPLKTCVVCDQSLEKESGPISFTYKRQEVKVCSEEHRAEFNKEPARYLAKIKEVKVL
jgi:hypothetical protein